MEKYPVTDQDVEKIDDAFSYHKPKDDQGERYNEIREEAHKLAILLLQNCPSSRERSVALTNLEQAVMWANKAIACNE